MRFLKFLALVLAVLCLSACGQNAAEPDEGMQRKIQKRCAEIQSQYIQLYEDADEQMPDSRWEEPVLSHNSLDAIEALLQQAGLDVLRSGEKGPEYLTTGEQFRTFLDAVGQDRQAGQEVISIRPSGTEPKIKYYIEVRSDMRSVADYDKATAAAEAKIDAVRKSLGI